MTYFNYIKMQDVLQSKKIVENRHFNWSGSPGPGPHQTGYTIYSRFQTTTNDLQRTSFINTTHNTLCYSLSLS